MGGRGGGNRLRRFGRSCGTASILQAGFGDRIWPQDQDHKVIFASPSQYPKPAQRASVVAIAQASISPISGLKLRL